MKNKTLSDLTKEEIGQLFPVEISRYSNNWPALFQQEKQLISAALSEEIVFRIEHFGSTSIPGLSAKNTIDILMEVNFDNSRDQKLVESMKKLGYDFNWQSEGNNTHMVFIKGYDLENPAQQTYHIHAGPKDHPIWDRLFFRDYLILNPETANQYEELKRNLATLYRHDRVAYRIAKTSFVQEITAKAKNIIE